MVSYIIEPFRMKSQENALNTHANYWAAWEIVNILNEMNFDVDIIEASNTRFIPVTEYNLVIGTLGCLDRFAPFVDADTKLIFYALGVYVDQRNGSKGELGRIKALEKRRSCHYTPKRLFRDPEMIKRSVAIADAVIVSGGKHTVSTFPDEIKKKITTCTIPVASHTIYKKTDDILISEAKEFVWFFGYGQVHKGLDLVIEAFSKLKNVKLNIIGTMEPDFYLAYEKELTQQSNIKYHGFLDPRENRFKRIMDRSFCFIAPSVNEGISPACISMLQAGLFPIISRGCGIDLPEGYGITLEEDTIESIQKAVEKVCAIGSQLLIKQIKVLRKFAEEKYSAEAFTHQFTTAIEKILS